MQTKYYTIKQAAKLLHVTPLTLRNWDKRGKLKAYRHPLNNYRVYKTEQLEMFLRRIEISRESSNKRKIDVYST
jgi:excisionase family DNA binding protein